MEEGADMRDNQKTNRGSLQPVEKGQVSIQDGFWAKTIDLVRNTVLPFQWEALNDRVPGAEPSHAIQNFRIAAGEAEGEHGGLVFQDSDLAKWLEAVGHSLRTSPDSELEAKADSVIDLIGKAQQPDGYLNTWFTLKEPGKRWTNLLDCHELYCAGHMMEAAVAYYEGTGKRKLLDVMCRFADHIDTVFGPEPGKLHGHDGHEEAELGLVKLYHATGEDRYLKLAAYMVNARGQEPNFFLEDWERHGRISHWDRKVQAQAPDLAYYQAHKPVREQDVAIGHAVRAVYLYAGMADIARETGDESLKEACERLFRNIADKQLYITGGIGQTVHGEAFTFDHDLPNDTVYQETCASIGLVFFAHRMLQFGANRLYADVMEQALYNSVISGMAADGRHFFYVNPLEVWPEASAKDPRKRHVLAERPHWYGCACCPPNLARLMASLGEYIYSQSADAVHTHLFVGGSAEIQLLDGAFRLVQETGFPWDGGVRLRVEAVEGKSCPTGAFTLGIRIPGWSRKPLLRVQGEPTWLEPLMDNGYACVRREWKPGDTLDLDLDLRPAFVTAHPRVRANAGRVALTYGPVVYCLEEVDNGDNLSALSVLTDAAPKATFEPTLLGGVVALAVQGLRDRETDWNGQALYRMREEGSVLVPSDPATLRAIPYHAWNNRGVGEMAVWMRAART
jgi:uncharacterized protein